MNCKKKIRSIATRIWILIHERVYKFEGHRIKYIYIDNKKPMLTVCFSGFPELGGKPRYNYLTALNHDKTSNHLFILDDMVNEPTSGSYYLGSEGEFWGLNGIPSLINYIKMKCLPEIVVTVGSSKGGTCALLYGALIEADVIIAGACQYLIGTYMNCEYYENVFSRLIDKPKKSEKEVEDIVSRLDGIVYDSLKNNPQKEKCHVYLQYSKLEHTYDESIKYLLNDLDKLSYNVTIDEKQFSNHGDIGLFFPQFIEKVLTTISRGYVIE